MARQLGPSAFGLVAMVMVFTDLANGIMESGFPQALVRRLDRSATDTSTVFYFNFTAGILLYGVMCACAQPIAHLYHEPQLSGIIPLLSLVLPVNALAIMQKVELTSALNFRSQAATSLCGAIAGGTVGLVMTFRGAGLMSIVWFQLVKASIECVALWVVGPWRPKLVFSGKAFRSLFSFGSRLALAGVINSIYNNTVQLVIGYFFHPASLGYYGRAHQFTTLPANNLTLVIQRVAYPALCNIRQDRARMSEAYRKLLRISVYIVFPCMAGLAVLSTTLVKILLGEEWLFTAVLIKILCLSFMWWPVNALNINLLQVVGRSDLFLRLEVLKELFGLVAIFLTVHFGLVALCWGLVANTIFSVVMNTYYSGRFADLGLLRQLREYLPAFCYSIAMAAVMLLLIYWVDNVWIRLTLGFFGGVATYFILSRLTASADLRELLSLLKEGLTARRLSS